MQDEINEKVIALSIRTTKLTAEMLQKSIRFMLSQIKKQLDKPVQHHGKQTLKQLMKQNAGVSSIEITDSNIKAFESTAKKYGVDFEKGRDGKPAPLPCVFQGARRGRFDRSLSGVFRKEADTGTKAFDPQGVSRL